jgi:invasion protein IalB
MKIERVIVGVVALLVGLLLGWMVRGVATYNVHAAQVATYEDWRVACPSADNKDAACELSSDLVDKSQPNGAVLARATITTDKDGK